MMQARLRGIKSLVRCAHRMMKPVVPVRVFSAEAAQAQDVYEHMSNMKTKDLFQFEPFNDEELVVCLFFVFLLIKRRISLAKPKVRIIPSTGLLLASGSLFGVMPTEILPTKCWLRRSVEM